MASYPAEVAWQHPVSDAGPCLDSVSSSACRYSSPTMMKYLEGKGDPYNSSNGAPTSGAPTTEGSSSLGSSGSSVSVTYSLPGCGRLLMLSSLTADPAKPLENAHSHPSD
jgi:hypothetical protein